MYGLSERHKFQLVLENNYGSIAVMNLNVLMVKRASVTVTFSSVLTCPFPYDRVNETFFTEIQNFSVNSPWWSLEYHNIMCGKTIKHVFLKYINAHHEETKFCTTGSKRH